MQADALHRRHEFVADLHYSQHSAPREAARTTAVEVPRTEVRRPAAKHESAAPNSAFSLVDMPVLWWLNASRMKSKVVAILETRAGAHLAELVARRGGVPLLAPALEEVPDIDPQALRSLLAQWRVRAFQNLHLSNRRGNASAVRRHRCGQLELRNCRNAWLHQSWLCEARSRLANSTRAAFASTSRQRRPSPPRWFSRRSRMFPWRALRFWCSAMAKPIKRSPQDLSPAAPRCRRSPRTAGRCPPTRSRS